MTQHDTTVRMQHMLDHAKEAVDLLAGKEKADLSRDRIRELALVRLVEIVGEAASRLLIEDQSRYPSIPPNKLPLPVHLAPCTVNHFFNFRHVLHLALNLLVQASVIRLAAGLRDNRQV